MQSIKTSRSQIVILGAGRSLHRDLPPALVEVAHRGRVMDWLLAAFEALEEPEIHFVSGYKTAEIRRRYPGIDFIFNPDWETTGPVASLSLVPIDASGPTFVTYSDVVFRPWTVERLESAEGDLVLAVDTNWRRRYEARSRSELDQAEKLALRGGEVVAIGVEVDTDKADAEFVGLLKLSVAGAAQLRDALATGDFPPRAALPELVGCLLDRGLTASVVDVGGDWAELNAPQDLARFVLGTKAESLARLKPLLKRGRIGSLVSFSQREWQADPQRVLGRIGETLGSARLIVRSSSRSEDQWTNSAAGAYESVPDVDGADEEQVAAAVNAVLLSYGEVHPDDQVLVQEMLQDLDVSGVVMTRTPDRRAPYYVISFDDSSRRTDTVTAGTSGSIRTVFLHRGYELREDLPPRLRHLLEVVRELEELVEHDSLHIEFAYTSDGTAHVLQVRPIALPRIELKLNKLATRRQKILKNSAMAPRAPMTADTIMLPAPGSR